MSSTPPSIYDRGRLMSPEQIAQEFFQSPKRTQWVRRNVAPARKLFLGHSTVRWWERDVVAWIDSHRSAA